MKYHNIVLYLSHTSPMELVLSDFLHTEFMLSFAMMNVGDVDMVSLLGGKDTSISKSSRDGCLLHTRPCNLSWYSDTVCPVRHKKGNKELLLPVLIKEKYQLIFSLKHAYSNDTTSNKRMHIFADSMQFYVNG